MKIFLETERLILRQFTEDDADNLLELDSDPEVVRFTPDAGKPKDYTVKPKFYLDFGTLRTIRRLRILGGG